MSSSSTRPFVTALDIFMYASLTYLSTHRSTSDTHTVARLSIRRPTPPRIVSRFCVSLDLELTSFFRAVYAFMQLFYAKFPKFAKK